MNDCKKLHDIISQKMSEFVELGNKARNTNKDCLELIVIRKDMESIMSDIKLFQGMLIHEITQFGFVIDALSKNKNMHTSPFFEIVSSTYGNHKTPDFTLKG